MTGYDKTEYYKNDPARQSLGFLMDSLEALLGRLDRNNKDAALRILTGLDQLQTRLQSQGENLTEQQPENPQRQYLVKRVQDNADTLLAALGGIEALKRLRAEFNPHPDAWWWFLDEWIARRNRKRLRRTFIIASVLIGVAAVLVFVYMRYLAPPPEVLARIRHENRAKSLITSADYETALAETNQALLFAPDNFSLLIQKGVLHQLLDQSQSAEKAFQKAQQIDPDPQLFLLERAYMYLQVEQYERMAADADALLGLNPESPEAFLFIAQAFEHSGDQFQALQAYETASKLAEEQQKIELMTTIRMRMSVLMQSFSPLTETP